MRFLAVLLLLASVADGAELKTNPLRFANRAQCAVDSEKPTRSVFLSLDTYNAGRLGFNFGKKMKVDPTLMAQTFVAEFQKRVLTLTAKNVSAPASCYVVSEFSQLQAPLHRPTISKEVLNGIAESAIDFRKTLTPCRDFIPTGAEKDLLIQLDILAPPPQWEKQGFEFWKNFKSNLSRDWRATNTEAKFESLLKTVDLEEAVMLFSQNCYSVIAPQCDQQSLAVNSLREFAKAKGTPSELDSPFPPIPSDLILKRGSRGVNNDFLESDSGRSTTAWLENYRLKKNEHTWIFRNKLLNASQFLNLLTIYSSPSELISNLKSQLGNPAVRDQLAAVCIEWRLSSDTKINFMGRRIHTLMKAPELLNKLSAPYGTKLTDAAKFYLETQKGFEDLCEESEKEAFHEGTANIKWTYISPWAQEIMKNLGFETTEGQVPATLSPHPFLILPETENVICSTSLDCAQKLFKSMIDLYLVSEYYGTFWTDGKLRSPALFNPYDELNSCKIYDPWFVKQRTKKIFAADLTSTALFGWNIVPLYVDLTYTFPKVTSLQALIENGAVKYNPQIKASEVRGALLADFGPLVGAPCALQISESGKPFNFYAFSGLSLNYCNQDVRKNWSATGAEEVTSDGKALEVCGGCTLSFTSIGSVASVTAWPATFNPIKLAVYLFRALYRLNEGMNNPVNVPRAVEINVSEIVNLYKQNNNSVPEGCVEQILQWGNCDPRRDLYNFQNEKGG